MRRQVVLALALGAVAMSGCGTNEPQILLFNVTPRQIDAGDPVTMRWAVRHADRCTIAPLALAVDPAAESLTTSDVPDVDTTLVLDCRGAGGRATAAAELRVRPEPPQILRFVAAPAIVPAGSPSTLTWTTAAVAACDLSELDGTVLATGLAGNGQRSVTPTITTSYQLRCHGSRDLADETTAATTTVFVPQQGAWSLRGRLWAEIPPATPDGLRLDAAVAVPVAGVPVQVVDGLDGTVVVEASADADGNYAVDFDGSSVVALRMLATSDEPTVVVRDNTAGNALWAAVSVTIDAATQQAFDLVATTGWNEQAQAYTGPRAAAPFAILGAAQQAAAAVLAARDYALPPLILNWSPNNRPENGDVDDGAIGTSHWDGEELFILGEADVDTDEFDRHVIVHEWGHYFEDAVARADSLGGSHSVGVLLDPRVAWSEGLANALSAIVLDPETVYTDTLGPAQGDGFGIDIDANGPGADPLPGWFSEASVHAIVYDLFDGDDDGDDEDWDTIELGLGPVLDALSGALVETPALATIFPFVRGLLDGGAAAGGVDALLTKHAMAPIRDDFGGDAGNDGGFAYTLPVYHELTTDDDASLTFGNASFANHLRRNRLLRFTAPGNAATIRTAADEDVDLYVFRTGALLAAQVTDSGHERVSVDTEPGATYVVGVQGWGTSNNYMATVSLTSP